MRRYQPPEPLVGRHQLTGFRCRSQEQSAWLVEVALLARLGVDERHEGQGLGAALLADAITRVVSSDSVSPPPSGKLSPVLLTTRGLKEMTSAAIQRGCQS